MLLGFLIRSALLAAAVSTIAIVISGIITKEKPQQELRASRMFNGAIIDKINNCTNTMTLHDLQNGNEIEVQGDDIDYSLYEGQVITI